MLTHILRLFNCSVLLLAIPFAAALPQLRSYQTHVRSMLRETIFNTGEIGRAYDKGQAGMLSGLSSMEWPPNSRTIIDRIEYSGQHNSMGGGMWIAGTARGSRQYSYCGAVSENTGKSTTVEGVYSNPIALTRTENYPVLANGRLNAAYNPDEAEEIIVSKWSTVGLNLTVTRTSRAWSYPGYDSFIIYEYAIQNTGPDTLWDVFVAFPYALAPSMFGYERRYNAWGEGNYRQGDQFARWDFKRWMGYNHDRYGKPDSTYFNLWSTPGNRGGLNSPQAAGFVTLYYDYDHLSDSGKTNIIVSSSDARVIWDRNRKVKQPYLNRYENGNIDGSTKQQAWLDPAQSRKTGPFASRADSVNFGSFASPQGDPYYWLGRAKPSYTLGWSQPVVHGYGFAPYTLPPGQTLRFALAEVVGYGPGRASDSVYMDLGGASTTSSADIGLHPVPSWYKEISYTNVGNPPVMGSNYLQTHPLPWYILDPNVVSIRDVADRAIQMYTGQPLAKHDSVQYEPIDSTRAMMKQRSGAGYYNTVSIPVPAPVIRVEDTRAAVNKIIWGPHVESFSVPRLHAPFKSYMVLRSRSALGPWTVIDSVSRRDVRYYRDSVYAVVDTASNIGENVYYAVVSVDSLGGKSGMSNLTAHQTQAPAAPMLGKVYVVPNPLIVTNGIINEQDLQGEVTDRVQFYGLTKRCTIRIFSYSGQLVNTIEHNSDGINNPWYQISRNSQLIASGVYFFVVEDEGGARVRGKFVVIH
jgi:hypothetical protein